MARVSIAGTMLALLVVFVPTPSSAADSESEIVANSAIILDQFMAISTRAIPESLLRNAEGVAIVPGLIKAGFVVGGRRGHGVVLVRTPTGWSNPIFVVLTGGSVGWQAGIQSTDVVLVFKSRKSVEGFLGGNKLTLTADAGLAIGPIGRQAEAGTDAKLDAEIYSYSRSRGLFVGVALEGAEIAVDGNADAAFYRRPATPGDIIQGAGIQTPPPAVELRAKLGHYTGVEAARMQ